MRAVRQLPILVRIHIATAHSPFYVRTHTCIAYCRYYLQHVTCILVRGNVCVCMRASSAEIQPKSQARVGFAFFVLKFIFCTFTVLLLSFGRRINCDIVIHLRRIQRCMPACAHSATLSPTHRPDRGDSKTKGINKWIILTLTGTEI